jgi:hypothetical protein
MIARFVWLSFPLVWIGCGSGPVGNGASQGRGSSSGGSAGSDGGAASGSGAPNGSGAGDHSGSAGSGSPASAGASDGSVPDTLACSKGPRGQFFAMTQSGAASARTSPFLLWNGSEMLVYGTCPGPTDALYSPCNDSWRPASWSLKTCAPLRVEAGSNVYLLNETPPTLIELDGVSARSTDLDTTGMPLTTQPTIAPTGSGLVVWGGATPINAGNDGYVGSNAGAVYDRGTNRWRPTSTAGAPLARMASSTWTGTEMAVWGGHSASSFQTSGGRIDCVVFPDPGCTLLGDGAFYDPTADRWTPVAATGDVPSPRRDHLIAWANGQLLVWGGYGFAKGQSAYGFTRDGALYDPKTQTWTKIADLPNAASLPEAAFWTGSRIVDVEDSSLRGWIYDPKSKAWAALAPISAMGGSWSCEPPTLQRGALLSSCPASNGVAMIALLPDGAAAWQHYPSAAGALENVGTLWTGTRLFVWGGAPPQDRSGCPPMVPCDPSPSAPTNAGWVLVP